MKKLLLSGVAFTSLIAGPAMAADLAPRVYKRPVAVVVDNWSGFYIGGNVGGSLAIISPTDTRTAPFTSETTSDRLGLPGAIGGVQVGYNWQAGLWLLGVEGDWQWSNEESTSTRAGQEVILGRTFTASNSDQERIRDLATVRGRLGYVHGDYLWFATGGAAWSRIESNFGLTESAPAVTLATTASFNTTRSGWTLGGGVETLLAPNWSAKLEYLYVDLGSVTNVFATAAAGGLGSFTANESVSEHIIRVGVNYKFGNYYAPVVAK
jgi:outer membrane immunogenic protein